jgi:hypothetical protein
MHLRETLFIHSATLSLAVKFKGKKIEEVIKVLFSTPPTQSSASFILQLPFHRG